MTRRVLDVNPLTGAIEYFEYDEASDTMIITMEQDVEPVLELNKLMANDPAYTKEGMKENWWHYAHLPDVVILKLKREYGLDVFNKEHTSRIFKLVNDPQWNLLKTTKKFHRPKD